MSGKDLMSADELRNRLFNNLRSKGVVNNIKTQLRKGIVTELQQTGTSNQQDRVIPDSDSPLYSAANSLICDHMKRCKFDYALSVFLPESGLTIDKLLSTTELLQRLQINPSSKLYRKLAANVTETSMKGFLWQLLCEISAVHSTPTHNEGAQTDHVPMVPMTYLDNKLLNVDEAYSYKRDDITRTSSGAAEERILSFQRQLEERSRSEVNLEIARFKDNEGARIRMEEKEKSRRELDNARRELERNYLAKSEALTTKERNNTERLEMEQQIQAKEVYTQRQSLLADIDAMRQREAQLKRDAETNQREMTLHDERIKARDDAIRNREAELRKVDAEYEMKLSNAISKFKLEEQARFLDRTQRLEIRDAKLKEDEHRMREDQDKIQKMKIELTEKSKRVNELEINVQELRYKDVHSSKNTDFMNAKLREMSDYNVLREENAVTKHELDSVKRRLSEQQHLYERERTRNEDHLRERNQPTHKEIAAERDLDRMRVSLQQEQVLANKHKLQMEARLKEEMDRNRDLLQQFEEQTLQQQDMNKELADLRQQLVVTRHALNNEVYRNPKSQADEYDYINQTLQEQDVAVSRAILTPNRTSERTTQWATRRSPARRSQHAPRRDETSTDDEVYQPSRPINVNMDETNTDECKSPDLIAEARHRLKNLDREAKNLENAYSDFQYRLTDPHAIPTLGGRGSPRRDTRREFSPSPHRAVHGRSYSTSPQRVSERRSVSPRRGLSQPRPQVHYEESRHRDEKTSTRRQGHDEVAMSSMHQSPIHRVHGSAEQAMSSTPHKKSRLSHEPDDDGQCMAQGMI